MEWGPARLPIAHAGKQGTAASLWASLKPGAWGRGRWLPQALRAPLPRPGAQGAGPQRFLGPEEPQELIITGLRR